jgi:tetratricopeptide (TPR) repeat protein
MRMISLRIFSASASKSIWLERALAADPGTDQLARAKAVHALGILADEAGENDRARELFEEALAIHRARGDRLRLAVSLNSLGVVARNQGDLARARELLEESLEIKRELGDEHGMSTTMSGLGVVLIDQGDYERARSILSESLELDERRGDRVGVAVNLSNLGAAALEQHDYETAHDELSAAVRAFVEVGDDDGLAECLEGLAALAASLGEPRRAATLAGAADSLRERVGSPMTEPDRARLDRYLARARAEVGPVVFNAEWERGRRLDRAAAVAEALDREGTATDL